MSPSHRAKATRAQKAPAKATDVSPHEWRSYRYRCPVEATLDIIGGRWKGVILFHLVRGPKRFSDFNRLYPAISDHSLALQLRDLESQGIVARHDFGETPPRVEYSLTPHGRALEPIILMMEEWGKSYVAPVAEPSS